LVFQFCNQAESFFLFVSEFNLERAWIVPERASLFKIDSTLPLVLFALGRIILELHFTSLA